MEADAKNRLKEQEEKLQKEKGDAVAECGREHELATQAMQTQHNEQLDLRLKTQETSLKSEQRHSLDKQKETLETERREKEKDFAIKGRNLRNKQLQNAKGSMLQALVSAFEQRDELV